VKASEFPIKCVDIQNDILMTGDSTGTLSLFDIKTNKRIQRLTGHKEAILCLQNTKNYVLSGSDDKRMIQWDLRDGRIVHVYKGHGDSVRCISMREDGIVFTGSYDHSVRCWNVPEVINYDAAMEEERKRLEEERKQMEENKKKKKGKNGKKVKKTKKK
jgi:WD40 repeat protein